MCKWNYADQVIAVAKASQLNILHPKHLSGFSETKSPFKPRCGREESVELLKATFSCKFGELQLTSQEQDRDCFLPRQMKSLIWCQENEKSLFVLSVEVNQIEC